MKKSVTLDWQANLVQIKDHVSEKKSRWTGRQLSFRTRIKSVKKVATVDRQAALVQNKDQISGKSSHGRLEGNSRSQLGPDQSKKQPRSTSRQLSFDYQHTLSGRTLG